MPVLRQERQSVHRSYAVLRVHGDCCYNIVTLCIIVYSSGGPRDMSFASLAITLRFSLFLACATGIYYPIPLCSMLVYSIPSIRGRVRCPLLCDMT